LVTAALGTGTCLFLYGTGRLLYGPGPGRASPAGLAAALLYALAPLAVQHGHFATVDVPAVFWISGALFFAARHGEKGGRSLFWAGLWAGLAAATKYNAGLVLLAGAAAGWIKPAARGRAATFVPLLGGAALGFVIGCPGALINPEGLWQGIQMEAAHVRGGHGLVFVNTPPGLIYHLVFNLRWGLGAPLLLLAVAGIVAALLRRRPGDLVLLAFAVPYYLLIGLAEVKFARYTLPLFPPLLLWAGALLTEREKVRRIAAWAGVAAAVYALAFSLALDRTMTRPDPRDRAAAFLREAGVRSVGFATGPWFYSPPLHPGLADFRPPVAKRNALLAENPRLIPAEGEWNVAQLQQTAPDAVALSELNEYADALRARHPPALAYLDALRRDYPSVRVFASPVQVFGLRFTNVTGRLPDQGLPHDMLYTNPTTIVWMRSSR
ncbi:MAG: glycosyltransferase family 39 protein, partial [Acetobacteraceae bacterium]|nr:glycosyltransferase family 39 protein [Acetobacteraceae bacterium]